MKFPFALLLLALGGCITLAPGADQVTVTRDPARVSGCTPVGSVSGTAAAAFSLDDPGKAMRNQAVALGGNRVLLTSAVPLAGTAYRCPPAVR